MEWIQMTRFAHNCKHLKGVDTAETLYYMLVYRIEDELIVMLDFSGIEKVEAKFLDELINLLYCKFSAARLRKCMQVRNMRKAHYDLLCRCIEKSRKLYCRDCFTESLMPYLNHYVDTPAGRGVLWQVTSDRIGVVLDKLEPDSNGKLVQRVTFFDDPKHIKPVREERMMA